MDETAFAEYREQHDLVATDHDRVWWTNDDPDYRAFDAATTIADEFPGLRVVGTESRIQSADVKWDLNADHDLLVLGFYPIRADKWTWDVIDDVREIVEGDDGQSGAES